VREIESERERDRDRQRIVCLSLSERKTTRWDGSAPPSKPTVGEPKSNVGKKV
jgi:hypothetical protein